MANDGGTLKNGKLIKNIRNPLKSSTKTNITKLMKRNVTFKHPTIEINPIQRRTCIPYNIKITADRLRNECNQVTRYTSDRHVVKDQIIEKSNVANDQSDTKPVRNENDDDDVVEIIQNENNEMNIVPAVDKKEFPKPQSLRRSNEPNQLIEDRLLSNSLSLPILTTNYLDHHSLTEKRKEIIHETESDNFKFLLRPASNSSNDRPMFELKIDYAAAKDAITNKLSNTMELNTNNSQVQPNHNGDNRNKFNIPSYFTIDALAKSSCSKDDLLIEKRAMIPVQTANKISPVSVKKPIPYSICNFEEWRKLKMKPKDIVYSNGRSLPDESIKYHTSILYGKLNDSKVSNTSFSYPTPTMQHDITPLSRLRRRSAPIGPPPRMYFSPVNDAFRERLYPPSDTIGKSSTHSSNLSAFRLPIHHNVRHSSSELHHNQRSDFTIPDYQSISLNSRYPLVSSNQSLDLMRSETSFRPTPEYYNCFQGLPYRKYNYDAYRMHPTFSRSAHYRYDSTLLYPPCGRYIDVPRIPMPTTNPGESMYSIPR